MEKYAIEGKTVVITGAGRGLGQALTKRFIRENARVMAISKSTALIEPLLDEHPDKLLCYELDIRDYHGVKNAIDQIAEKTGRIDVLFNNAAVYPKVNFLEESIEAWEEAIAINLNGVANCCKAVLPHMVKARHGRIYNVGSWADRSPVVNSAAYSTSKGGLHALTKSIAKDLEPLNLDVQVHEWIPGHLNTRMSGFTGIDPAQSAEWAVHIVQSTASKKNCIFENDQECLPQKGLRTQIKEMFRFWK